ncbi:MAG: HAMP domain-containing histidine kinase [Lachnospiraceae bacterium]|nr:HAMP domain-containing histidine kinase [Lachnospiraceae bacterium]MBO5144966.1 HAMP domain-containing histidine kinase [Lachnospiraceae bacterium]
MKNGKLFRSFKSLKMRIFCIIIVAGMIPCVMLHYGVLDRYLDNAVSVRTSEVQTQVRIIADHLITYNYLLDNSSDVVNAELSQLSNLYDGRVLIMDSNMKIIKDTYGISEGKTIISENIIKCFKEGGASNHLEENGYIEIVVPIEEKIEDKARTVGVMQISVSTDSIRTSYEYIQSRAFLLEMLAMVVIVGIAYFLSRKLLKPFEKITDAINEVKNGFTDEEISVTDYTETEQIGDAFNQMMGRMKVLDESRQEFVSNVSHELKTPLASMKVLADSLLTQEDVPSELYREFMTDIAAEIDRENKIITDLLSLVKMTRTSADMNVETMDINSILELMLKRLGPIATRANVKLIFESRRPVSAEVDEVKLTLALSNLVENAIKYNIDGGWVKVILDADHQYFTVEVSDSGIGIPQESIEHIYERFYRVDKSHSKEIGGTGLGLAITRSAVVMHRGSINVRSEEGVGTVFTVKIPLTYIAQ